jgi:hypothetical protein
MQIAAHARQHVTASIVWPCCSGLFNTWGQQLLIGAITPEAHAAFAVKSDRRVVTVWCLPDAIIGSVLGSQGMASAGANTAEVYGFAVYLSSIICYGAPPALVCRAAHRASGHCPGRCSTDSSHCTHTSSACTIVLCPLRGAAHVQCSTWLGRSYQRRLSRPLASPTIRASAPLHCTSGWVHLNGALTVHVLGSVHSAHAAAIPGLVRSDQGLGYES